MSEDAPNEILEAARDAKVQGQAAARAVADKSKSWPLAKIGLGIGSAAVAAAVLYANRSRTK